MKKLTNKHAPKLAAIFIGVFTFMFADLSFAQRASTTAGLDRLEESIAPVVEDGALTGISPILFVSARPISEETRSEYPMAALRVLVSIFGPQNIRACEGCMNPRIYSSEGRLEHNSVLTLEEIARLDQNIRGKGAPALAAVWLDETPRGVSIRIVAIQNGAILFAGNFDENFSEKRRSGKNLTATLDLERRIRGESLTHIFLDAALYPGQHISLDVVEQFGPLNKNLAGVTFSAWDPALGLGVVYYRIIPSAWNLTVGVQVVASLPTVLIGALVRAIDDDADVPELIDPALTAVGVVRFPIPQTNFALLLTGSTNGNFGAGITFTNVTFLPILP